MTRRVLALIAVLAATMTITPAAPAFAAGAKLVFRKVYVNSPGPDTRSNTSLNAEYIVVRNIGGAGKNLQGWKVRDKAGHTYTFGAFVLGAGTYVKLHTGKGTNTTHHRYWGSGNYIWNNGGDKAYLKNPSGTTVDSCSWGKVASYIMC